MRGKPTDQFLADYLRNLSTFLKRDARTTAAKWTKCASRRIELLSAQVRSERAKADFLEALREEKARQK